VLMLWNCCAGILTEPEHSNMMVRLGPCGPTHVASPNSSCAFWLSAANMLAGIKSLRMPPITDLPVPPSPKMHVSFCQSSQSVRLSSGNSQRPSMTQNQ